MSANPSGALFLSYASQDAEAARRICDALRAAGVEVWFDQSELSAFAKLRRDKRGGDAWDQKIRRQIKSCALFVPIISANTNTRLEGYFRLEWLQAVNRLRLDALNRSETVREFVGRFVAGAGTIRGRRCSGRGCGRWCG